MAFDDSTHRNQDVHEELYHQMSAMPSSSPPQSIFTTSSGKERKPPTVTPRTFRRFFTPRSSMTTSSSEDSFGSSGRQLREITRAALNRRSNGSRRLGTPRKTVDFAEIPQELPVETPKMNSRKRKTAYLSPDSSPALSSPSKRFRIAPPPAFAILEDEEALLAQGCEESYEESPCPPLPIRRLRSVGNSSVRVVQRSFGGVQGIGRGFVRDHCASSQALTADFYSDPGDLYEMSTGAPPFCSASCNGEYYNILLEPTHKPITSLKTLRFAATESCDSQLTRRRRRRRWVHAPT